VFSAEAPVSSSRATTSVSAHADRQGNLAFEPNVGQFEPGTSFGADAGSDLLKATREGIRIAARDASGPSGVDEVTMRVGDRCAWVGERGLSSRTHYLVGSDSGKWSRNVPNFSSLRARGVFSGVDLVLYGNDGRIEYDFVVDPGGDPGAIGLEFPNSRVSVSDRGDLVVKAPRRKIVHQAPHAFQVDRGVARLVACRFATGPGGIVRFVLGAYDRSLPLVIDPIIAFETTFQGGLAQDLDVDSLGRAVSVARTSLTTDSDIRVARFTPGGRLLFTTVIAGNGEDEPSTVAFGPDGNIYLGGSTTSANFPVTPGSLDETYGGGTDAFAMALSADGASLLYSTYLGGAALDDIARGAVTDDGRFCVVGMTASPDFPATVGAFDTMFNDAPAGYPRDAFAAQLSADGSTLAFSTFLGGSGGDWATDCVLAPDGSLYVCGTPGPEYPVTPGAIAELPGYWPVFVSRLSADGSSLLLSARVGNAGGQAMALDAAGNVYVGGSGGFGISTGRYFSKLDPGLTTLIYRSYGSRHPNGEIVADLSVDDTGIVIAGGLVVNNAAVTIVPADGSTYSNLNVLPESSRFTALKSSGNGVFFGCGSRSSFFAAVSRFVLASSSGINLALGQNAPATFVSGTSADLVYTVTNSGAEVAPRVALEIEFAAPLELEGAVSTQGSVAESPLMGGSGIVLFDLGDLAPGSTATATVSVDLPCSSVNAALLQANATVSTLAAEVDLSQNNTSWTSAVTNPAPVLACDNIVVPASPGGCTAAVTFTPDVSDNCPGPVAVCSPASGTVFAVGSTTVQCSATDSGGRQSYCSFSVTVLDQQPPTINGPVVLEMITLPGCTRQVGIITALANATDNCTAPSSILVTQTPAPSAVLGPGEYPASLTASDLAGNSTIHQFTLRVVDRTPPVLSCPPNMLVLTSAQSQAVTYATPTASDNCPSPSVSCVPSSGSSFPFGTTTVTCTAVDAAGNASSCSFNVELRRPNDTIGVYVPSTSTLFLRNDNSPGGAEYAYGYGAPGYGLIPVFGDWDNNGTETAGMFYPEARFFFLKNTHTPGGADLSFRAQTTATAYVPIAGDWNGDGIDTTGYFIPSSRQFQLRNVNAAGLATVTFTFSPATGFLQAITGDWNADGTDTVGLYNSATGTFYLRNANTTGGAQITFGFGPIGGVPIAGDWNGDGLTTVGVYDAATGTFYLRNSNSAGPADLVFAYGPLGATPIAGNWDGQ
jgi:hypothetical protein